jgi:hypothetical protein
MKASGQSGMFVRRKFFLAVKENISCGILFHYVFGNAPKFVLNYTFTPNPRCVCAAHGGMRGNLTGTPSGTAMEMLFH